MKAIARFARTTIVGGVFFLAPIVMLIVILAKPYMKLVQQHRLDLRRALRSADAAQGRRGLQERTSIRRKCPLTFSSYPPPLA
jgi:hypothetical protein